MIGRNEPNSNFCWYSRPELNWDQRFRKPLLYPFELRELLSCHAAAAEYPKPWHGANVGITVKQAFSELPPKTEWVEAPAHSPVASRVLVTADQPLRHFHRFTQRL